MQWQAAAVLGLLAVLNLVATAIVVRYPWYSPGQRIVQAAMIWLLPLLGAVVCVAMARTEAREVPSPLSTHDPDPGSSVGFDGQGPSLCDGGDGAGASGD